MEQNELTPNPQGLEQNLPPNGQTLPEGEQEVKLTGEQYNAILDHIATLETKLMERPGGEKQVQSLDDLISEAEGRSKAPPPVDDTKLEDMSPQQVVGMLYQAIRQELIQPLETKLETMRIMNEIDKVANTPGNEDFWEYADTVKAIAIKNPTLSIKQAYNLAKTDSPRKPGAPGDAGLLKKNDVLFTLPPRPKAGAGGERPQAPGSSMRPSGEISRRDAASAAFDSVVNKGSK